MGLDQYGYFIKKDDKEAFQQSEDNVAMEICDETMDYLEHDFYWRKHADLERFMADLYNSRGGTEEFNCLYLPIYKEDIEELRQRTKNHKLEKGEGFFWGQSTPEDYTDTLKFCDLAEKHLEEGGMVLYSSWW